MDNNEEEGSFERIIIHNERDGAPGDAFPQIVSQVDCFTYSSEHDVPSDGTYRSCVNFYKYTNHKSEVLFAMTIGLMDYDKMVSEPPFSLVKRKNTLAVFQPSNTCLQQEIARRCHFLSAEYVHDEDHLLWNEKKKKVIIPRPKQWQRGPLFEWLKSYRHQYRSDDEEFLIEEVTRLKKVIEQALETDNFEKKKGASTAPFWDGRSGWSSLTPNLRLIEIVLLPRLRGDFLARDNALSRQALDARGTVHEPVSFWEKIQTLFNDESFVVESIILDSSWGGRFFLQPINLGWEMLQSVSVHPIDSPLFAKQKFMSLTNSLGGILQRWQRSGTGEGNADEIMSDDDDLEATIPIPKQQDLETSSGDQFSFIGDASPAAMYLWYNLERCGLLEQSLAEISIGYAADGNAVPSVIANSTRATSSASAGKSTTNPPVSLATASSNVFAEILEANADKHDRNVKMLLDILSERNRIDEQNRLITAKVDILKERKRSYEQFMMKASEMLDRAEEKVDDEFCAGNLQRQLKWEQKVRDYSDRLEWYRKKIISLVQRIEKVYAQAPNGINVPIGGNGNANSDSGDSDVEEEYLNNVENAQPPNNDGNHVENVENENVENVQPPNNGDNNGDNIDDPDNGENPIPNNGENPNSGENVEDTQSTT